MAAFADTVALLRELMVLGFTDDAYHVLGIAQDSIQAHLAHASQHANAELDPYSELVQRRLRLVRDAYVKAAFRSGNPDVFRALAVAARAEIAG